MQLMKAVPALPVQDMEAATDFYRYQLRFTVIHKVEDYAILVRDAVELHLWLAYDRSWQSRWKELESRPVTSGAESFLAGTASCRIEVQDIESLYEEYKNNDVLYDVDTVVEPKPWGTREFSALDLERNLLTFFQKS